MFTNWNFRKIDICQQKLAYCFRIGCEFPFNLVEFLERDINLEKELEKFEGDFERDKVVEVWKWNKNNSGYVLKNCL